MNNVNTEEIEEKAMVIQDKRVAAPDIIRQAELLAEKTWKFMGITKETAVSVYLKGWELGFKMTAAPEFIHNIQGKPALSPRGHLALLHHSGIFKNGGFLRAKHFITPEGDLACTVAMKRGDSDVEYERTVTMEDARRAGLVKKGSGWENWPENMLLWRGTGFVADFVAPDVGGGMKRADEYGADISPDGDVIIGSWIENRSQPQITLNDLLSRFSPDDILSANEGRMPSTQAEINAVMAKLSKD